MLGMCEHIGRSPFRVLSGWLVCVGDLIRMANSQRLQTPSKHDPDAIQAGTTRRESKYYIIQRLK